MATPNGQFRAWVGDDDAIGTGPGLGFERIGAIGQGGTISVLEYQDTSSDTHFKQGMDPLVLQDAFREALLKSGNTAAAIIEGVKLATEGYSVSDRLSAHQGLRKIMRVAFSGDERHCPLPEAGRRELRRYMHDALETGLKLVK